MIPPFFSHCSAPLLPGQERGVSLRPSCAFRPMFHDLSAACRRLVGRASARRRRRGNVGNDHDGLGETVRAMRRFPTRGRGVGTSRRFRHPLWASWAIPLPAGHAKNGGCGLFRLIMGRRRRKHVAAETCRSRGFVAGGVAEALAAPCSMPGSQRGAFTWATGAGCGSKCGITASRSECSATGF